MIGHNLSLIALKLAAVSGVVKPRATPSSATAHIVDTPPIAIVVPPRAVKLDPKAVPSVPPTTADPPAVITAPQTKSATLLAVLIACAVYSAFA